MIDVSRLSFAEPAPLLDDISEELDSLNLRHAIDVINWKEFDYKPAVVFSIAYTSYEILLKYYVTENFFKAEKTESNEAVYEDTCVEFFISPSDDGIYYNFEFNGIGTCLAGLGQGRVGRLKIDPIAISGIRRKSSAGAEPIKEKSGKFSWEITIALPTDVFIFHKIDLSPGKTFKANFYKCGDGLRTPHYLTWSPVETLKPDYHRPEYFGLLKFI